MRVVHEESGAVALMVAVVFTVLAAAAALALDAGAYWRTRRAMVTATDATALAVAQTMATSAVDPDCTGTATTWLAANASGASITGCSVYPSGDDSGYVTVSAQTNVQFSFASFLGIDSQTVASTTSAQFGPPVTLRGVRPLALCIANDEYAAWLAARTPGTEAEIPLARVSACGGAPGNWGLLNFDGNLGTPELGDDFVNGHQGELAVGDTVRGTTGVRGQSIAPYLDKILGESFYLVVFDSVSNVGANAEFRIAGFVGIQLISYDLKGEGAKAATDDQAMWTIAGETFRPLAAAGGAGKPDDGDDKPGGGPPGGQPPGGGNPTETPSPTPSPTPADDGSLTVKFVSLHGSGRCCKAVTGSDSGIRVSKICSVDPAPADALARCTTTVP